MHPCQLLGFICHAQLSGNREDIAVQRAARQHTVICKLARPCVDEGDRVTLRHAVNEDTLKAADELRASRTTLVPGQLATRRMGGYTRWQNGWVYEMAFSTARECGSVREKVMIHCG
jgi:hypothetical protein